jgi:hypothetical protein
MDGLNSAPVAGKNVHSMPRKTESLLDILQPQDYYQMESLLSIKEDWH